MGFGVRWKFVPTDLAAISETVRVCASAVELYCDECQIARSCRGPVYWHAVREPASGPCHFLMVKLMPMIFWPVRENCLSSARWLFLRMTLEASRFMKLSRARARARVSRILLVRDHRT